MNSARACLHLSCVLLRSCPNSRWHFQVLKKKRLIRTSSSGFIQPRWIVGSGPLGRTPAERRSRAGRQTAAGNWKRVLASLSVSLKTFSCWAGPSLFLCEYDGNWTVKISFQKPEAKYKASTNSSQSIFDLSSRGSQDHSSSWLIGPRCSRASTRPAGSSGFGWSQIEQQFNGNVIIASASRRTIPLENLYWTNTAAKSPLQITICPTFKTKPPVWIYQENIWILFTYK